MKEVGNVLKKRTLGIITILLVMLIFQGCSKKNNELIGTWYGENNTNITLNEDGTFISDWILNGKYSLDENSRVILKSNIETKELEYDKENDVLIASDRLKFYRNESDLKSSIENGIDEVLKNIQDNIIGKWKRDLIGKKDEIEFFEDGTYIHSTEGYIGEELGEGTYSLEKTDNDSYKDYCIIKFADKEGKEIKSYISINNKSMYLDNVKKSYEKIN